MNNESRYYTLNEYCKATFGEKVYRLSLNGGMTCPNRDGTLSYGGCTFCSEGGSGDFAANGALSIAKQLEEAKERIAGKTDCKKFIAYFQSFTNTYAPVDRLRELYLAAIAPEDVVALSIGTRCDCIDDAVLSLLQEMNAIKPVWVELGLQTIHNETHARLNTFTTKELFESTYKRLTDAGIPVVVHLIIGLPGESKEDLFSSIEYVARLHPFGVKLQLLHILYDTRLADQYQASPFPVLGLEEYVDLAIDCVERLPKDVVIHRLTGDGPKALLIAPLWSGDKKKVLNTFTRRFRERDARQGRLCKTDVVP